MNDIRLPLYVYGHATLYRDCFNMIASLLGEGGYKQLLSLFILAGSTWAIVGTILKRDMLVYGKWLLGYFILYQALFIPKATVNIIDRVGSRSAGKAAYKVDHVPLGFAIVASYTSRIGSKLTELTEQVFSLPDDVKYSHTGMLMASKTVAALHDLPLPDNQMTQNLRHYVRQCVVYDLLLKRYSKQQVLMSQDPWDFLKAHASKARAFDYDGNIITCSAGILKFDPQWKTLIDTGQHHLLNTLFPSVNIINSDARNLPATLLATVSSNINYLTQTSQSAAELIKQQFVQNALKQGVLDWKGQLSDRYAGANVLAYTLAQQHKRQANLTIGQMASHWLPLMKTIFELLLYSSVIFMVLLGFLPNGTAILKHYVGSLFWVQLWAPLYAIINFAVSDYAHSISFAKLASLGSANHLSILGVNALAPMQQDLASLAGYLSMSVPFLALGITQGMAKTLTSMAQYVGGITQSSAMAGVGVASTGNVSLGNTSLNNTNAHNTSMNHLDTSGRVISGMMSASMPGGSTMSLSADGTPVMDTRSGVSHLPTTVNFAQAMRQQYGIQIERGENTLHNTIDNYANTVADNVRHLFQVSDIEANQHSDTYSEGYQHSDGKTNMYSKLHDKIHSYAKAHHITDAKAKETLVDDYVSAKIRGDFNTSGTAAGKVVNRMYGVSGSATLTGGESHTGRHTKSHREDDSKTTTDSTSDRESVLSQIDEVIRHTKDQQSRVMSETSKRHLTDLQKGLDEADIERHEIADQEQKLYSLRRTKQYLKENSTSFNQDLSQNFVQWLSEQPMGGQTGPMGWRAAETLLAHEPETTALYAVDYMRTAAKGHLNAKMKFIRREDEEIL